MSRAFLITQSLVQSYIAAIIVILAPRAGCSA
jgi:hypothetical protein